ncbi:MAG: DUF2088 domain-containing protein [Candidatus Lokiarchaeota archaeon]|nr:DUF2088 domain-containing protein [Candidatus Lokiarchaeota archaeon]
MRLNLRYGEGYLPLENGTLSQMDRYEPRSVVGFQDISKSIFRAIESPVGCASLSSLLSKCSSVCLVIEDIQNVLIQKVTRLLIRIINNMRTNLKKMSVLISSTSSNLADIEASLDNPSELGMNVEIHDYRKTKQLILAGSTPTHSTPLLLSKTFLSSDLRIGVGPISPDLFIGATGGRTAVVPGIAGEKTIRSNLKLQTTSPFSGYDSMSHASKDMLEAANIAGLDFIVNIVEDFQGNLASIAVGEPEDAWDIGAKACYNVAAITPKKRYDIAVVCGGGTPYDQTFFDSISSLYNGYQFTRHNGVIVLVAECQDGVGSDGFIKAITSTSSETEVQLLAHNGFMSGMERARVYHRIISQRNIIVCSRMSHALVEEKLRADSVRDPQEGFELARQITGTKSDIAVLENSHWIIPRI